MIKKKLLTIALCFLMLPVMPIMQSHADNFQYYDESDVELDEGYTEDDGMITANFLSDEEILYVENLDAENDDTTQDYSDENTTIASAISYATSKIGSPYSKGRRHSGSAFDCSSLVYHSYLNAGIDLSYQGTDTAAAIAHGLIASGKEVSASDLQPGDLIFYSNCKNGRFHNISHVSMYIGNGQQIEASYSKKIVKTRAVSLDGAVNVCRPTL